ncbi:maleylpyruvate isomerase family mycothiol-dependent enzyme [Aeromicrobium sp.]|uniref:maleylpyruvate isomerase family mycothiol-dependent enzyme n=1 Tax=Aeromicrobium sp. TaxID=1871063 RepID=UPI0028AEBA22|nr:maleylpyruvate isomerase family mycothiol-dependent enzyme [Aeromicrobium sp.]
MDRAEVQALIRDERARLLGVLEALRPEQWRTTSRCPRWSVEDVVAHLSAAASTGTSAWIASIVRARFDTDRHNDRLIRRHRVDTPAETLATFRALVPSRTAPAGAHVAMLGEVVVHGQDIVRPLGVELVPDPAAVLEVARFFASKDFAVNSRTLVRDLSLAADDAGFAAGSGPAVTGPLLELTLAMAGRSESIARLRGPGVEELGRRIAAAA